MIENPFEYDDYIPDDIINSIENKQSDIKDEDENKDDELINNKMNEISGIQNINEKKNKMTKMKSKVLNTTTIIENNNHKEDSSFSILSYLCCCNINIYSYNKYFDIKTQDVLNRLKMIWNYKQSLSISLYSNSNSILDLWTPLWVTNTLSIITAISHSIYISNQKELNYIEQDELNNDIIYDNNIDISILTTSFTLNYLFLFLIASLMYLSANSISFYENISIYGYISSLWLLIPLTFYFNNSFIKHCLQFVIYLYSLLIILKNSLFILTINLKHRKNIILLLLICFIQFFNLLIYHLIYFN